MKIHIGWRFCNNRRCKRKDCLRHISNMEFNVLSMVKNDYICGEDNDYKEILLGVPKEPELSYEDLGYIPDDYDGEPIPEKDSEDEEKIKGYVDFLNDIIKHSRAQFYIEPFVGNSNSISKITGINSKFGTDINEEKLKNKMKECGGTDKQFKVGEYKIWDGVLLLSDKYKGKCIVFCEPPKKDSEAFNMEDFIEKAKAWGTKNKVYVRCGKLKRKRPLYTIGDNDFIYQL